MPTHYERLGVGVRATAGEIKTAYRRLVLEHHPDRSRNPLSKEIFLAGTEAYEVLSDPERRRAYDESLEQVARYHAEQARVENLRRAQARAAYPEPPRKALAEVQRLAALVAQRRLAEAERLANEIRQLDARQPLPYAVLADIARSRGNIDEAARLYAYAAQFEPNNPIYQRRYEQLLASSSVVAGRNDATRLAKQMEVRLALGVTALLITVLALTPLLFAHQSAFPGNGVISTWTWPWIASLLGSGLTLGLGLRLGNWLDRMIQVGSVNIALPLALVALASFWAAALIYAALGIFQRGFNFSATRLFLGVLAVAIILSLAGVLGGIAFGQAITWSGGAVYATAIVGWLIADTAKQPEGT